MFFKAQRTLTARGFTLLEATIVLAILGIVVAGIWIASASAINSQKRKHLSEQVITTVTNVRDYLKNVDVPPTTTLLTANIQGLGLFPADSIRSGTTINAYGGLFAAQASNANVRIEVGGITSDACVDLLYSHFGGATGGATTQDLGFLGYNTNGGGTMITAITFTNITAACNPVADNYYLFFSP